MTRQQAAGVMDVVAKISMLITPLFLMLLCWNAAQIVQRIDRIEDKLTAVQVAQGNQETRLADTKERLMLHIRGDN